MKEKNVRLLIFDKRKKKMEESPEEFHFFLPFSDKLRFFIPKTSTVIFAEKTKTNTREHTRTVRYIRNGNGYTIAVHVTLVLLTRFYDVIPANFLLFFPLDELYYYHYYYLYYRYCYCCYHYCSHCYYLLQS